MMMIVDIEDFEFLLFRNFEVDVKMTSKGYQLNIKSNKWIISHSK